MDFKKIRLGFDMRRNKIINSNVDNPTSNKEISNKEYVDLGDKFDTVNATTKPISTKFTWMTNLGNLSIKTVLDKLLFPVVYPVYINPTLKKYTITNFGESNNIQGNFINGKLYYEISSSSRTPTINYKLVVKYNDATEVEFSDSTSIGNITFNFVWGNIESIKLKQVFTPAIVQNDSEGNPFIDSNFATTYDFSYSFDQYEFEKEFNISKGIYHKLNITPANLNGFINGNEADLKTAFIFNNMINLETQLVTDTQGNPNNTLLLIHESLINKFCNIVFKRNNIYLSSLELHIGQKLLMNPSEEFFKVNFSDGQYYFALIDFGKYNNITKVLISF